MADIAKLERALINADAAGDVEAAKALAAEIRRVRSSPESAAVAGPREGAKAMKSFADEVRGGLASAPINLALGIKQGVAGLTPVEQDVLAQNKEAQSAAPMASLASNLLTYAPIAMAPGANTIAGGAAYGAMQGLAQPVEEGESRLKNAGAGALGGAAVPFMIRGGKAAKAALVDPFTEAGRDRIAGSVINRASADPQAVAARLQTVQGATPGFVPSAGQAAGDAGLASLERTIRAIDPKRFDALDSSQREALAAAVRGVAKDDVAKAAAVAAREQAVNPLYTQAKQAVVPVDQTIAELMQRPAVRQAMGEAVTNASNKGGSIGVSATAPAPIGVLDASGNMIMSQGNFGTLNGNALHEIKMALDSAKDFNPMGGANKAQSSAVGAAASDFQNWLESKIPEYGQAKQTFAQMSRPINQMDIGREFEKRLIPALYRDMDSPAQLNAAAYARALTDQGDDIARNVTGMKGTTLPKIMEPDQMQALQGVASDLQMMKAAENAGRGVGSDTVQKASMSHLAAEAGIPNWMASIARVPGGWLKRAGDAVYGNADEAVRVRLAEMLANPQGTAQAMNAAGATPSKLAEALKKISIGAGQGTGAYLTAQ